MLGCAGTRGQVEVLETPYEPNELQRGAIGVVTEVQNAHEREQGFVVEGRSEGDAVSWRHTFRRGQITAASTLSFGTVRVDLGPSDA